jgi:hypothetical protein
MQQSLLLFEHDVFKVTSTLAQTLLKPSAVLTISHFCAVPYTCRISMKICVVNPY